MVSPLLTSYAMVDRIMLALNLVVVNVFNLLRGEVTQPHPTYDG